MNDFANIPDDKKQSVSTAAIGNASLVIPDKRSHTIIQKKQSSTREQSTTFPIQPVADISKSYFKDNRLQAIVQREQVNALAEKSYAGIVQRKANNTGLPDTLKSGIENLSGHSMDDVKVHYNSSEPAQLSAHAYAQGTDIHIASGQEKHLSHEAWHVVQQKQGRVKPTMQLKGRVDVNDDQALEKEADVMGTRSLQNNTGGVQSEKQTVLIQRVPKGPVQRVVVPGLPFHTIVQVNSGPTIGSHVRIVAPFTNPGNPDEKGYFTSDVETGFHRSYLYAQLDPVDEAVDPVAAVDPIEEEEERAPEDEEMRDQDPITALLATEGGDWVHRGRNAVEYVLRITGLGVDSLKITTSGGISLTIIPEGNPFVYQWFPDDTFRQLQELEERIRNGSDKLKRSIAGIHALVPSENLAVMEKIVPLNVLFNLFGDDGGIFKKFVRQNANKLAWDISIAIHELAKVGVVQNDVSVDNIGIRDGQFVLFDFDKARQSDDGSSDAESLFKSLHDRGGIHQNDLAALHARILQHLQVIDQEGEDPKAGAFLKLQIKGLPEVP